LLDAYEQKLTSILMYKLSGERYVIGRDCQINIFKNIYEGVML